MSFVTLPIVKAFICVRVSHNYRVNLAPELMNIRLVIRWSDADNCTIIIAPISFITPKEDSALRN